MRNFYAVYDEQDNFINCGFGYKELGIDQNAFYYCLRTNKAVNGKKVYRIPLTPQKDIFHDEDLLFLQEESESIFTDRELAEKEGISIREFYRRRAYCERRGKSNRNFGR